MTRPERASRPYDRDRDGFVMGEGAGVVVLEEYEHAKRRGARIYGELIGYGLSGDAFHITAPAEDGDGAFRCMKAAIRRAEISPGDVDYINAHGTSTPVGDEIELKAVERLVGNAAGKISMSSTKSSIGHCSARPARSRRFSACWRCATRWCRRRSIWTIRPSIPLLISCRTRRASARLISRFRTRSDSAAPTLRSYFAACRISAVTPVPVRHICSALPCNADESGLRPIWRMRRKRGAAVRSAEGHLLAEHARQAKRISDGGGQSSPVQW